MMSMCRNAATGTDNAVSGAGSGLREASSSAVALRSLLLVHVGICLQAACLTITSLKPHEANFEFSRGPSFSVSSWTP